MSITGDEKSVPLRVGYPVADTIGGLTAAFAICAALNNRDSGAFIDVSMLEAVIATMGWAVSNWLIAGVAPGAHGNENVTAAPSGAFQAADGLVNIAANKDEQWQVLAKHIGREDLLQHPDYRTREDRKANRYALKAEIEKALETRPAREVARELNILGVPAGAVLSVPDILAHEVIASRGILAGFPAVPGAERPIRVLRTGVKLNGRAPGVDDPPPRLGEHNSEILAGLGLSADEIDELKGEGVI